MKLNRQLTFINFNIPKNRIAVRTKNYIYKFHRGIDFNKPRKYIYVHNFGFVQ